MLHDGPVPYLVHGLLDYVLGAFLIASPFIFGFSDAAAPTGLFIGLGVLEFILFVATGFPREERRLRA